MAPHGAFVLSGSVGWVIVSLESRFANQANSPDEMIAPAFGKTVPSDYVPHLTRAGTRVHRVRMNLRRILPDHFVSLLLLAMLLATLLPARGIVADAVKLASTAGIVLLFFFHGARLARDAVIQALVHWRLHLMILVITYALFPALGLLLSLAIPAALPPAMWTGILFLCVLPSTVQSSIAFTAMARGNVAAAVTSAAASNLLAIGLTPLLLGLVVQVHGASVSVAGAGAIALQLLLPFAIGHLARPVVGGFVEKHRARLGLLDRGTIILAVYAAFSAAVVEGLWRQVTPHHLVALILLCALLLLLVMSLSYLLAQRAGFSRADRIAIFFAGSKKSLVTGIPMARILFPASVLGLVILPLLLFHQLQLMVCAALAQRWAKDVVEDG
jgi:solute carrier family 10 (sodium/bile acid cotransporter), member 7